MSQHSGFPARAARGEKGQSLVEFVLVLGLLLMIAAGALDLGRVFHSLIVITNSAREGARFLTLNPGDKGAGFAGTKAAAVQEATGSMIILTGDDVSVTTCIDLDTKPGCDSGTEVRVAVQYQFNSIMGWFLRDPITLTRSAEMMVP
jgi:Flp pilus assembly protein TadG